MSWKILVVIICISFIHDSWGVLDDGVELCYSFRPVAPGMEDLSIRWNGSYFYSLSVEKIEDESQNNRYARITLKAINADDRPFVGFVLRAIVDPGNSKRSEWGSLPIGAFSPAPDCDLISCFRGLNNAIIHHDAGAKSEAVVEWTPPIYRGKTPGSIIFVATVIESPKSYWYGISSKPMVI